MSTWWRSWLRHCATSRKVAGLIPDGVTGIVHWHNSPGCTLALRLTQPLIDGGKDDWCVGLTTLPRPCADCLEIWQPQSSGTLWDCPGLQWDCCTFYCKILHRMVFWFGVLFTTDQKITQRLLNSQLLESHVPLVHYLTWLIRTVSNKHDGHYYACASFNVILTSNKTFLISSLNLQVAKHFQFRKH
jgi:hypothetical protein